MKKILAFFTLLLIIGCGEEHSPPVGPYPEIDRLYDTGWEAFKSGDFELAEARFDSILEIDVTVPDAYLGLIWAQTRLGKYEDAEMNFAYLLAVEGKRPVVLKRSVDLEPSPTDTLGLTLLIPDSNLISPQRFTVISKHLLSEEIRVDTQVVQEGDSIYVVIEVDTIREYGEYVYDIVDWDKGWIKLRWSDENDTTLIPITSEDELDVWYYAIEGDGTPLQIDGYAAMCVMYTKSEEYGEAVAHGLSVIWMSPEYEFSVIPGYLDADKIHLFLAHSYYNLGYYIKSLSEVQKVDTTFTPDTSSSTFLYELEERITSLLSGEGE